MPEKPTYEELKQRIEVIEEAQGFYKSLLDMLPEYISYIDKNHTFQFVNKAYQAFFNLGPHSIVGLHPREVLGDDAFAEVAPRHKAALSGLEQQFESTFKLPNEEPYNFRVRYLPHVDGGQVQGFWAILQDITAHHKTDQALSKCKYIFQRKKAEETLKSKDAHFRSIYDSNLIGIAYWKASGELFDANDAWLNTIGYTREDMMRGETDWLKITPPEYLHLDEKGIQQIKERGFCDPFEKEYIKKDGTRVPILIGGAALSDIEGGGVTYMVDMTEIKKAKKALEKKELEFKLVTETIEDVFWMSTYGVEEMIYISPGYESLWQKSRESLYQEPKSFLEVIHPEDLDGFLDLLEKYHRNGRYYACKYRILRKTGKIRWIQERGYPVSRQIEGKKLMTGICTDITEMVEAKLELEEINVALKVLLDKREKEKNELGENVYRNIEELILPYIKKLRKVELPQNGKTYLEIIESNLNELLLPFGGKLKFSRPALTPTEIRIADLIRNGLTTKEIAELLGVSNNAVMVHRHHIRKKLDLLNKKVNLRTYLISTS